LLRRRFGRREATACCLAWRLTDRSQQSEAGIRRKPCLQLLKLGGERLTGLGPFQALLEERPAGKEHSKL